MGRAISGTEGRCAGIELPFVFNASSADSNEGKFLIFFQGLDMHVVLQIARSSSAAPQQEVKSTCNALHKQIEK